jgi:hypothetical protein
MKQDSTVTFTATPDSGATFSGWGSDCASAGTALTCTLTLTGQGGNGAESITAGFGTPPPPPPMFTLTVKKPGTGTGFVGGGGIDCGKTCSKTLVQGTKVSLIAVADPRSLFLGWSGPCSGAGSCRVTVKTNTDAVAIFVDPRRPYVFTLPASGHVGSTIRLRLRAWSSKGMTSETLTVGNGRAVLETAKVPLRRLTFAHVIGVAWTVPTTESAGSLRFCAVATDMTGKRSPKSCSLLLIS